MLLKKPLREFVRASANMQIDNNNISYASIAHDKETPTVVFENGFCLGMSCMKYWDRVFLQLSQNYSVFAYDREDSALQMQTIEDIDRYIHDTLAHLRTLLRAKNLTPPYILVGHSLGGLYSQLFAQMYPQEVVGLVLLDAVYPQKSEQKDIIDKNIAQIAQSLLQKPKLDDSLSITILSALQSHTKTNQCATAKMIESAIADQKAYGAFYPFATQRWVESGHLIQYEKPQVVVDAVEGMGISHKPI